MMKSAIELCIDAAAKLAKTKTDKQAARETVPYAREELTALRAEVEAGIAQSPYTDVLVDWLRARGDKARAALKQLADEAERYVITVNFLAVLPASVDPTGDSTKLNAAIDTARAELEADDAKED